MAQQTPQQVIEGQRQDWNRVAGSYYGRSERIIFPLAARMVSARKPLSRP